MAERQWGISALSPDVRLRAAPFKCVSPQGLRVALQDGGGGLSMQQVCAPCCDASALSQAIGHTFHT
eukprot:10603049-Lingulodinium_polyedra.AAC.1